MEGQLANGSIGALLKQMPPVLRRRLNDDIARLDQARLLARKEGESKIATLANHLRWVVELKPPLPLMKVELYCVLAKYFPLSIDMIMENKLPAQSDCTYFWAREIKNLERQADKPNAVYQ